MLILCGRTVETSGLCQFIVYYVVQTYVIICTHVWVHARVQALARIFTELQKFISFLLKRIPITKIVKFPQNLKVLKGRGDLYPCCYDLEWTEITARGDRRPNLLLLHFQIISNNSKGKWNVGGKLYLPSSGFKNSY